MGVLGDARFASIPGRKKGAVGVQMNRLKGRRALVTGADRGIGAGIAQKLIAEGARVCLNTFGDPSEVAARLEPSQSDGTGSFVFRADVRDEVQVKRLVEAAWMTFGGVDVVVNNAGVESIQSALELSLDEWDRVLDTNLRGAFLVSRTCAASMRVNGVGGVIVNISSIHATIPRLGTAHYCASKAGLDMLTRSLALEWAEFGIRVVGIAPGAIETDINREVLDHIGRDNFARWIPLRRVGNLADISEALVFLCSDEARYISGATLPIDGAYSLNTIQYDPRTF
jgi:NAD(P)-dependent dehydrogenase (short-subunit alcohol dehydrogenase family)